MITQKKVSDKNFGSVEQRKMKLESPDQFIARLRAYFNRWVDLSTTEKSYNAIVDFMIRE